MKIALLLASAEEGGLENHVIDLANGLVTMRNDVTLFAHPRYFDRCDPRVNRAPVESASRRNPLARRRLRQAIIASGADILHAHAGKAAAITHAIQPTLHEAGMRTVATVHGLKGSLEDYAACDHVIGVSHGVVDRLPPTTPHTVVYNGVDAPPARRHSRTTVAETLDVDPARAISLAVGRLVPVKAYDVLIDAWRDSFGTLAIIGEGPEAEALERRADGKSIVFAGFRSDVRSWYSGADLMVFSSSREGFSYAMAEALRARLPVVSTDVPGAREILPTMLLASQATLGATIQAALGDLERTRRLSEPIFDWAERTLTVDAMVTSVRQVYATVMAHDE